jgi:hypothetical protein
MKMQYNVIGEHNGHKVAAGTDKLGSQIIYGGKNDTIHLLSYPYVDHEQACIAAKKVITDGIEITKWWNIKSKCPGLDYELYVLISCLRTDR